MRRTITLACSLLPLKPLMPAAEIDRVNAINLRGVWNCMKHELRQMREQGSGAIVNCSSIGGLIGLPGRAAYHVQAWRDRTDEECCARIRVQGYPNQRGMPGNDRDADGGGDAGQGTGGYG